MQSYRQKVNNMATVLEFFTTHEFEFITENVEELKHRLTLADQSTFNFDIARIDWKEYVTTYFLGISKHLNNNNNSNNNTPREST